MHEYFVYILASQSRRLYVGMTSNLLRRLAQHRSGACPGHTARYRITRLVYWETTLNVRSAIEREKALKRLHRRQKLRLIEGSNAGWRDLAAGWLSDDILPCHPAASQRMLGSRLHGTVARRGE